jgi:hypothetical protein
MVRVEVAVADWPEQRLAMQAVPADETELTADKRLAFPIELHVSDEAVVVACRASSSG